MADWLRVQGTNTEIGSGATNSLSFGAAVTNGNAVFGWLLLQNSVNANLPVGVVKVTDDKNNVYNIVTTGFDGGTPAPGLVVAQYMSEHLITNAPTTITATTTVSTSVFWMIQEEWQPPTGTTDISLSGQQYMVNDTGFTLPNFATLDNDTLVIGCSLASISSSTGAGFTAGMGTGTQICTESKIQATPTNTMSVSWTAPGGNTWAAAMAIAPVAQTRWKPVQRAIQRTGTGTTAALSFPNPVGPGNMVVGSIACDNAGLTHLTSLQDDKGTNYSLISGTLNSGQGTGDRQTWWSNGLLNNSPQTVTATYNASQTINSLIMDEFAPPPGTISVTIDGTPTNMFNNTPQTSVTTPNVTTTKNGDLAYGWGDNAGLFDKPANSFSATNGQSMSWMTAYSITGAPAPYDFICNTNSGAVDASLAIFNATVSTVTLGAMRLM